MTSGMHGDQGATTAPSPHVPADPTPATGGAARAGNRHPRRRRRAVVVLAVLLVLALGAAVYLLTVARAWQERADEVDAAARELGAELAETRVDLEESESTLSLVESQLDGAQQQIHELADTVAQTGDDREVQRQVADYQAELFTAATAVTGTMGQCISSQTEYTLALEDELARLTAPEPTAEPTESPSPAATDEPERDLGAMRQEVVETCQAASDAHESLRERLGDS